MDDTITNERPAKRVKIEDEVSTVVLPEQNVGVQTPSKQPQAQAPDQRPAKLEQDVPNATAPSTKAEMPSNSPKTIHIDPRGDVKVLVQDSNGRNHTIFVVCSRTLARVSPNWESMLFPRGAEKHELPKPGLDLTWNDPETLKIVLHILHANASRVPDRLTRNQIMQILCLGRKFKIMPALLIWSIKWHSDLTEVSASGPRATIDLVIRIWCTNELGLTASFHTDMRTAAYILQVDDNSDLVIFRYPEGVVGQLKIFPLQDESCIELLTKLRSSAIKEQLEYLKDVTQSLISPNAKRASPVSACQECIYKWTGCIIQHLIAPQPSAINAEVKISPLWPIPPLEAYRWSVEDLRKHLQTVQDKLDSLERCQEVASGHLSQGRTSRPYGRAGFRGANDNGGSRGNGSTTCEPPKLLLPSPCQSFDLDIKKLKTRYEREHGADNERQR